MSAGIYQITQASNGLRYIGSAVNIADRWGLHVRQLNNGRHHSAWLQRCWDKYGRAAFEFSVLEDVSNNGLLLAREQVWLDRERPEFNSCRVAGSQLGVKRSAETRALIGAKMKGRPVSDATRSKLSVAGAGNKHNNGRKHSVASRAKMSAASIGRKCSDAARANMSAARLGRKVSAETLAQRKGRKASAGACANMSAAGFTRCARVRAASEADAMIRGLQAVVRSDRGQTQ